MPLDSLTCSNGHNFIGREQGWQTKLRLMDLIVEFPHQAGDIKWLGDLVLVPAAISHGVLVECDLKKLFPKRFPETWFFTQRVSANCNAREKLEYQEEQNLSFKFHFVLSQMFFKSKPSPDPNFHFHSIDWWFECWGKSSQNLFMWYKYRNRLVPSIRISFWYKRKASRSHVLFFEA